MMIDRSITLTADMPNAVRKGVKTQVRHPIRIDPLYQTEVIRHPEFGWCGVMTKSNYLSYSPVRCRFGEVGDRPWIREKHWTDKKEIADLGFKRAFFSNGEVVCSNGLRAIAPGFDAPGWTPQKIEEVYKLTDSLKVVSPIIMQRWAALTLVEVTDIRVERLQSITEDDCYNEGVFPLAGDTQAGCYRRGFVTWWNRTYRNRSRDRWESNPWVFVANIKHLRHGVDYQS